VKFQDSKKKIDQSRYFSVSLGIESSDTSDRPPQIAGSYATLPPEPEAKKRSGTAILAASVEQKK